MQTEGIMDTEKIKFNLGCIVGTMLVIFILLICGRCTHIVSPVKVWIPSLQIWFADLSVSYDNYEYLQCLNKKADSFEQTGYHRRELKTRKKILRYYIDQRDTTSTNYAIAKIKYIRCNNFKNFNEDIQDAKNILWKAWKWGYLSDEGKEYLVMILMRTENSSIIESKQTFSDILSIADNMISSPKKYSYQHLALCALAYICMSDISTWSEAQSYIDRINPNLCKEDYLREECWLNKAQFQLYLHNTFLAQQYLDSAKVVGCRNEKEVIHVTEIQRAIFQSMGDNSNAMVEQKHLVALQYGLSRGDRLKRSLLQLERAIRLQRKWQAVWHKAILDYEMEKNVSKIKNMDTISSSKRLLYSKLYVKMQMLNVEYYLTFGGEGRNLQDMIDDIAASPYLLPDQQLQLMDFRIKASLLCPTDSISNILQSCVTAMQNRLRSSFPFFTDGEKASFWTAEEPVLRQVYAINNSADVKYDIALLSKGLLLVSSNNVKRSILESGDMALIQDWKLLQLLRQAELLNLESLEIDLSRQVLNTNIVKKQGRINEKVIPDYANELERSIIKRSITYERLYNTWEINWKDVQSQLKENETAIEIVHYPIEKDVQYDALILRKNDSLPICVHIGRESSYKLDASEMFMKRSYLIDTIWAPISPYLLDGKVYISMDGWFHHHNLEAMVANQDGELLSDLYHIVRVSSTRNLVQSVSPEIKKAALFGGVDYGKSDMSASKDIQHTTVSEETERGFKFTNKKRKKSYVNPLPYTLVEVNGVDSLLKSQGCETKLYVKQMATENAFKAMSGDSICVLHISTHGIVDQLSDGNADPMRYCCLLLAGANNTLSKTKPTAGNQDGLLTASEISALDFRGTDLVVLSACNTAGGEVTAEGVFGLQRAFKQAGVKSILMSLSGINDAITAEFMREYYLQLVDGYDKRSALTRTRNIIRSQYPKSLDWTSFILLD